MGDHRRAAADDPQGGGGHQERLDPGRCDQQLAPRLPGHPRGLGAGGPHALPGGLQPRLRCRAVRPGRGAAVHLPTGPGEVEPRTGAPGLVTR